jgi:hypothetical protein
MKANEAPERIWIDPATDLPKLSGHIDKNSVEYIRKDIFMKKAENFLEMLGYGFTITDNITHANYGKEQIIADFRNYMEGE